MSAGPGPLRVETLDGAVWVQAAVTRAGLGLYCPEGVASCPRFVMATLAELAEHGVKAAPPVTDVADAVALLGALPMPVGDPLIVSRFDTAIEPAPEEDPVLIVGAVADNGRPVALLLDLEARSKVARWLAPELESAGLASPWERAVAGLNALVDANIAFWVEPDGHISGPFGDEHIEWDQKTKRWVLTHDEDEGLAPLGPEDPCHPCGCPKRFDRHADGCAYSECPSCGASADATGQRIPEHRTGCPLDDATPSGGAL